ncbi:MAG: UvrD-helicase domain-containing protein [Sutterellaceae bacterium]|nr:UvrD-helicase domain-containing protein [Sutterellaceae bacterium]MDY2868665.1 UvrD-helicase domain-containing protein [Mesosutterella sp.]
MAETKTPVSFNCDETPLSRLMFIEASAGTGKTYTLQRLILRLIAEEDVKISEFLVVTFTDAATAELSSRVREILRDAYLATAPGSEGEPAREKKRKELEPLLLKWRGEGISEDVLHGRVDAALRDFGEVSIYTIHGFCRRMLQSWAFSGGTPFSGDIGDDSRIEAEAVDEFKRLWLGIAERGGEGGEPDPGLASDVLRLDGRGILRWMRTHPKKGFRVTDASPGAERMIRDFCGKVQGEVNRRKEAEGLISYDDILIRMQETVARSEEFRARVRKLYRAVLIDEFQDTDTLQYAIFRDLFLAEGLSPQPFVTFVGDPKQSIYSFRGAEISVYLGAKRNAELRASPYSLLTNFRTTPPEVAAVNTLFTAPGGGSKIPGIGYDPVGSSASRLPLFGRDESGALKPLDAFEVWSARWCSGSEAEAAGYPVTSAEARRTAEARLMAERVSELLTRETYVGKRLLDPKKSLGDARVKPSDIALLVRNHKDSAAVELELSKIGIRVLHLSGDDVFATKEAEELLTVLQAIAPSSGKGRMDAARATRICGRTLSEIRSEDSSLYLRDLERFRAAAAAYASHGLAAAVSSVFKSFGTVGRLLGTPGGERSLTNWSHITELLHASDERMRNFEALVRRYEIALEDARSGKASVPEERSLRVESDESLVRVATIFAAKGLEYPVVFLPEASKLGARRSGGSRRDGPKDNRSEFVWKPDGSWDYRFAPKAGEGSAGSDDPDEVYRIAYVAATRSSASLVIPLIPGYKRGRYGLSPANVGSVWTRLLAPNLDDPLPAEMGKNGKLKKPKPLKAEDRARRIQAGLDALAERLASESPFRDGALKVRMAEALREAAKETKDEAKRSVLGEAAGSLLAMKPDETLAEVKAFENRDLEPKDLPKVSLPGAEPPEFVLPRNRLPASARVSSYSSITRGFELAGEEDADEGYENSSAGVSGAAPEAIDSPSYIGGGKDTGDAVHNILEACMNAGLHREALLSDDDAWARGFRRALESAGASGLADRVPVEEGDPEDPGELFRAKLARANAWLRDRLRGVFLADLAKGKKREDGSPRVPGGLRLSEVPEGCAAAELPFSIAVEAEKLKASEFASDIIRFNDRFRHSEGLPLAALAESSWSPELKGFLEGRIDLMFQSGSDGKFWLLDWKTDQPGRTIADYGPAGLRGVMLREKYGWQALFYLVAARRMIEGAYEITPDEALSRLGGICYVFVRGFSEKAPPEIPAAAVLTPDPRIIDLADTLLMKGTAKEKED